MQEIADWLAVEYIRGVALETEHNHGLQLERQNANRLCSLGMSGITVESYSKERNASMLATIIFMMLICRAFGGAQQFVACRRLSAAMSFGG